MAIPATGASQSLSYTRIGGAGLAIGIVGVAAVVAALAIVALVPAVSATAGIALLPYAVVVLPVALGVMAVAGAVALALLFARTKQAVPAVVAPAVPAPPSPRAPSPAPSPLPSPRTPSPAPLLIPAVDPEPEVVIPSSPSPILSSPLVDSRSASAEEAAQELAEVTRVIEDITEGVNRWNEALQISPTTTPPLGFNQSMAVDNKIDELVNEFEEINPEDVEAYPEAVVGLGRRVLDWFHQTDLTPQDASVLRVKAAKYEALLDTVNHALSNQGLPLFRVPAKQDSIEYLTHVRDLFEVDVLNTLRSGDPRYDAVCYALYTANDMDKANEGLIQLYGLERPEAGLGLLERLEAVNTAVDNVGAEKTTNILNRWARSLKDKMGIRFSPIGAGNPPQKMFKLALNDREVNILGFGSPTIQESNFSEVVIDPLFLGYLRHLKAQGKRHLYVSNQNALNEENARNRVIMALAESEEFAGTFIAITQSKNTKAYHARGTDHSIEAVKQRVHGAFFQRGIDQSGCGLPEGLRSDSGFEKRSRYFVNAIHQLYFEGKAVLTEAEERLFIEMHYNLMTLEIAAKMNIENINFTCKDGIDRGMGSLAWFIMLIEFASGNKEAPETEEKLITTFFTRAYWTRKRNILHERFERPIEDMKTLEGLDPRFTKTKAILNSIVNGGVQILPHTASRGPSAAEAAAIVSA